MNRRGSFPVHWSRYLRLTVIVSSPLIDSSRSTTTCAPRPFRRASETTASVLPSSGARPKSPPRLDSVGPATFSLPTSAPRMRAITPLPARVGPTSSRILCRSSRPEIDVPEPLLQRLDRRPGRRGHSSSQEREPALRRRRVGVVGERDARSALKKSGVCGEQRRGAPTSSSPFAHGDDQPVVVAAVEPCRLADALGQVGDRGERVEQVGDLVPVRRPRLRLGAVLRRRHRTRACSVKRVGLGAHRRAARSRPSGSSPLPPAAAPVAQEAASRTSPCTERRRGRGRRPSAPWVPAASAPPLDRRGASASAVKGHRSSSGPPLVSRRASSACTSCGRRSPPGSRRST